MLIERIPINVLNRYNTLNMVQCFLSLDAGDKLT